MSTKRFTRLALAFSTLACFIGAQTAQAGTHSITHTQTTLDQTDFQALGFGQAGYYFAQFAASSPVTERAPQDNMRFALPSWASMQFDITQSDRTFSGDAGFFQGILVIPSMKSLPLAILWFLAFTPREDNLPGIHSLCPMVNWACPVLWWMKAPKTIRTIR